MHNVALLSDSAPPSDSAQMPDPAQPSDRVNRAYVDSTAQRLRETEAAIREQRRYLDSLSEPSSRAVAARTLGALEDMLLIMTRTRRLPMDPLVAV